MYKPLLMMRTRGLMGPIPFKAAKLTTSLVKSAGAFISAAGGEPPVIDPPIASGVFAPPDANVGVSYSYDTSVLFTGGFVLTYTLNGALPDGLSLHPNTGVISGIPTQEEVVSNISITGTNTTGSDTTNTASITVGADVAVPIPCEDVIYGSHVDVDIVNINDSNGVFATLGGDAAVSAADSKFGARSAYVPLGNDANDLLVNNHTLLSGTKTMQMFFKITEPSGSVQYNGLVGGFGNNIVVYANFITDGGQLEARIGSDKYVSSVIVSTDEWHHLAVTFNDGNDTKIYLDGVLVITAQPITVINAQVAFFGSSGSAFGSGELGGYIDEPLLLTTVEYTGDFTPPTEPFETTCAPPVGNLDFIAAKEALTDVQNVDLEGNIMNIMPKGDIVATHSHSTNVWALDSDNIYQEYQIDAPVYKGGRVVAGTTYKDSFDVFAQCNNATTNMLMLSEVIDTSNSSWAGGGSGVATQGQSVIDPKNGTSASLIDLSATTDSRVYQGFDMNIDNDYVGSIHLRSVTGTGTYPMSIYDGTTSHNIIVTLTEEWKRYEISMTAVKGGASYLYVGDRRGSGGLNTLNTAYGWGAQVEQQSTVGIYVPTDTTAVSIPPLSYTYPASNINTSNSEITLVIDYEGDEPNIIDIGGHVLLNVGGGNIQLQDNSANIISLPISIGHHSISITLTATTMELVLDGNSSSSAYVPITAGLITIDEDFYNFTSKTQA